jgi:hypothetical protein
MAAQIDEIFPPYTGITLNRGLSQTDFDDAEEYFQGYHATFVPIINTWRDEANLLSTAVNGYSGDALASATASANSALQSASSTNNVGAWSVQTGSANPPLSTTHTGSSWILNIPLADITTSEPTSINSDWTEISGVTQEELDAKRDIDDSYSQTEINDALALKASLTGATFTGQVKLKKGADVASATALPIISDGNYFDVTGTTTITSIDTTGAVGTVIKLHFDAILLLTNHATDLILPSGANITTAPGDEAEFIEYASGDFRCTYYTRANGEAVIGGGKTLQVLSSTKSDTMTTSSSSFVDITGLSVTITPKNVNSRFKIQFTTSIGNTTVTATSFVRLIRDSTPIAIGDAAGNRIRSSASSFNENGAAATNVSVGYVDSPATASPITYKAQLATRSGFVATLNRGGSDADTASVSRTITTLIVEEIGE